MKKLVAPLILLSILSSPFTARASFWDLAGLALDPNVAAFMNSRSYKQLKASGAIDAMYESGLFEKMAASGELQKAIKNGAIQRFADSPELKQGIADKRLMEMAQNGELEKLMHDSVSAPAAGRAPAAKPALAAKPEAGARDAASPSGGSGPISTASPITAAPAPTRQAATAAPAAATVTAEVAAPVIPAPAGKRSGTFVGQAPPAAPAVPTAPVAKPAAPSSEQLVTIEGSESYSRPVLRAARAPRPRRATPERRDGASDFDRMIAEGLRGFERMITGAVGQMQIPELAPHPTTRPARQTRPSRASARVPESMPTLGDLQSALDEIFGGSGHPVAPKSKSSRRRARTVREVATAQQRQPARKSSAAQDPFGGLQKDIESAFADLIR